jgi:hypothetical protein
MCDTRRSRAFTIRLREVYTHHIRNILDNLSFSVFDEQISSSPLREVVSHFKALTELLHFSFLELINV